MKIYEDLRKSTKNKQKIMKINDNQLKSIEINENVYKSNKFDESHHKNIRKKESAAEAKPVNFRSSMHPGRAWPGRAGRAGRACRRLVLCLLTFGRIIELTEGFLSNLQHSIHPTIDRPSKKV